MSRGDVSWRIAWVSIIVTAASCSFDWDGFDPRVGTGSNASAGGGAMGGAGGMSSSSTSTTATGGNTTSTGGGGVGGVGGAGGGTCDGGAPSGTLVDRGLVTRYYLDEAASGTQPTALTDAAPTPLNLPITYVDGNTFTEVDCQRGMSWPGISLDGRADAPVLGTKIETALDGSRTGTIECVINLQDADVSSSRISHIGTDSGTGRFTMFSDGPASLGFDWDDQLGMVIGTVEEWTIDLANLGRIVAHIVLDTNLAAAADRVRLYVDGVDQGVGDIHNSAVPQNSETEIIASTDTHVLGNRSIGGRSFLGTIYYCAMYSEALTGSEVTNNVTVLLAADDTP
jgi:hypothetical protein